MLNKVIVFDVHDPLLEIYATLEIRPDIKGLSDHELGQIIVWEREMFQGVGGLLKEHDVLAQLRKTLDMFAVDLMNVDEEYFKLRESTVCIDQKIIDDLEPRAVERHNTIMREYFPWSLETMRNNLTVINWGERYIQRKKYVNLGNVLLREEHYFSRYIHLCKAYEDVPHMDRVRLAVDIQKTTSAELGLWAAYRYFLEAYQRGLF